MDYVLNADKLISKLDQLSQDKIISTGLNKVGAFVEGQAKINSPIDNGQLRSSLMFESDGKTVVIGTNVEYAPYVEFGTGIWAAAGDGRKDRWSYQDAEGNWHSTIGQKPQPFLKPAVDNNYNEIQDLFNQSLQEELKKICQM